MKSTISRRGTMLFLLAAVSGVTGCTVTDVDQSEYNRGPAPLRQPSPAREEAQSYEDSLTGGKIFSMYCGACHNARYLSERPFSNYQNVAAHMRVRANLTGKEYAKLLEFMRRIHDVPEPNPAPAPSPKRFIFSQPIGELREEGVKPPPPKVQGAAPQDLPHLPTPAAILELPPPAGAPQPIGTLPAEAPKQRD